MISIVLDYVRCFPQPQGIYWYELILISRIHLSQQVNKQQTKVSLWVGKSAHKNRYEQNWYRFYLCPVCVCVCSRVYYIIKFMVYCVYCTVFHFRCFYTFFCVSFGNFLPIAYKAFRTFIFVCENPNRLCIFSLAFANIVRLTYVTQKVGAEKGNNCLLFVVEW